MASALKRLLHFALLVTLLVPECRPAPLADISCQDDFSTLINIVNTLGAQAAHLLDEYMVFHGLSGEPPNVPDYAVMGSNFFEQLQDIYAKNVLFQLHLAKVEKYQNEDWGNPRNVAEPLDQVKGNLMFSSAILMKLARQVQPEVELATEEPPHETHDHSWAKKSYGWKVIAGLKNWVADVNRVLKVMQAPCNNRINETERRTVRAPKSRRRRTRDRFSC
ncbi:uncharacterized protein LOC133154313 [Syngnathus typhle]|uniref:uncharacterized protein LOC133154313 n=1 Tax=Syngnathus typhle TaxID=161592 RepID=UPI002A6A02C1|nr:uncharacterized protein LOC133154313 [Syngnathus typhle]